jgi:hypothetical protein
VAVVPDGHAADDEEIDTCFRQLREDSADIKLSQDGGGVRIARLGT